MIWERAVAENAWELDDGLYRILLPLPFAAPFVNVYLVESRSESTPLSASLVLPSHGLPWRGSPREATQGLLDFHRHFATQIHRLLRERTLNAWQIARALNPAIPADPVGIRFSLAEVLAVLVHLERQGSVRHEPDGRWQAS